MIKVKAAPTKGRLLLFRDLLKVDVILFVGCGALKWSVNLYIYIYQNSPAICKRWRGYLANKG